LTQHNAFDAFRRNLRRLTVDGRLAAQALAVQLNTAATNQQYGGDGIVAAGPQDQRVKL